MQHRALLRAVTAGMGEASTTGQANSLTALRTRNQHITANQPSAKKLKKQSPSDSEGLMPCGRKQRTKEPLDESQRGE